MKSVLVAFELGADPFELAAIQEVAKEIAADGSPCRLILAVDDLDLAAAAIGGQAVGMLQAPVWPISAFIGNDLGDLGYTDRLAEIGFGTRRTLAAVTSAWRALIALTKPDAIVACDSPGLVAATYGVDGPSVIAIGSCATMPPLHGGAFPPARLGQGPAIPEARLLACAKAMLADVAIDPPQRLVDLFETKDGSSSAHRSSIPIATCVASRFICRSPERAARHCLPSSRAFSSALVRIALSRWEFSKASLSWTFRSKHSFRPTSAWPTPCWCAEAIRSMRRRLRSLMPSSDRRTSFTAAKASWRPRRSRRGGRS